MTTPTEREREEAKKIVAQFEAFAAYTGDEVACREALTESIAHALSTRSAYVEKLEAEVADHRMRAERITREREALWNATDDAKAVLKLAAESNGSVGG